ncbi:hypothetical protein BsWGS_07100 [Bradybaena similaris]
MEANNADANNTKNSNQSGYGYPSQPGPAPYYPENPAPPTYYHDMAGQPQYYQPHPAATPYYPGTANNMSSNTVVVTQPAAYVTQVVPVQDHMGLAIFACLCCFWPLGLVAIFRASASRDAIARGDVNEARLSAADARKFSLISIGVGVVLILIAIIVPIIIVTTAATSYSYSYRNY